MRPFVLAIALCFAAAPALGQSIHLSQYETDCDVSSDSRLGARYFVLLYAPDNQDAIGAQFRLDVTDFGQEDSAILTAPNGMTVYGDVRTGVTVLWSPHSFWVEDIVEVEFVDNAPVAYPDGFVFASVVEAKLVVPGGAIDLDDTQSYRVHCYGSGGLDFEPPLDPVVVAGATNTVEFRGISLGADYGPGCDRPHGDGQPGVGAAVPRSAVDLQLQQMPVVLGHDGPDGGGSGGDAGRCRDRCDHPQSRPGLHLVHAHRHADNLRRIPYLGSRQSTLSLVSRFIP